MDLFIEGFREALRLIVGLDRDVLGSAFRSLWISTLAVSSAGLVGVSAGVWVSRVSFPGRGVLVTLLRAGMAVPTVFVGILCYGIVAREGPLGDLGLLFTPWAIVVGEWLLALPIVFSLSHGAIGSLDPRVFDTARTLGAGPLRRGWTYVSEARTGVVLGLLTAFARCVTELGVALMVGGNIAGRTRTLSTATALETGKGEFGRGLAMGLILLVLSLGVTGVVAFLSRDERERQGGERS